MVCRPSILYLHTSLSKWVSIYTKMSSRRSLIKFISIIYNTKVYESIRFSNVRPWNFSCESHTGMSPNIASLFMHFLFSTITSHTLFFNFYCCVISHTATMSSTRRQEKTTNPAKALGLTPSQAEHPLLGYLGTQKPTVSDEMYDLISKYLYLRRILSAGRLEEAGEAQQCYAFLR